MKPEIKREWVEALRSGEYEQTQKSLCDGVGFCCLGVLCDISRTHSIGEWVPSESRDYFAVNEEDWHDSYLPQSLLDWSGLSMDEQDLLAEMNDTGSTFGDIAEYIEKNL